MTSIFHDKLLPPIPETYRGTPIVMCASSDKFLYCNNKYVVVRDIQNPEMSRLYNGHKDIVRSVRISQNGNHVASGDNSGKVHIWSMNPDEFITKHEHHILSGPIRDIAWTNNNDKLVAVGGSLSTFANFFRIDSSNPISKVSYSTKAINSVDLSPVNPLRCCMGSEDQRIYFLSGNKLERMVELRNHASFVQCCRFAADGSVFVTGGSDSKVFVFNGESGALLRELSPSHKGGIYAVAPSPDSRQVLTASGDKTAAIYDIETGQQVQSFRMGTEIEDMQLGCLWHQKGLISVSLSGYINYLDPKSGSNPYKVIQGHKCSYTSSLLSRGSIFMGSHDGRISKYDISSDSTTVLLKNQVNVKSLVKSSDSVLSLSLDNSVRSFNEETLKLNDWDYSLPSRPYSSACDQECVVIGCDDCIVFMRSLSVTATLSVSEAAQCCDLSLAAGHVVATHHETVVYKIPCDGKFESIKTLPKLSCVKYSPNGNYLAGVEDKVVRIFSTSDYKELGRGYYGNDSNIQSVAWSPDSNMVMTSSIGSSIKMWKVGGHMLPVIDHERAHFTSPLVSAFFISNDKVATLGMDCCVNLWTIK